ncbi:diaminopimelate decarboxylase [Sphingomonas sp. Leaf67]|uniref:diaminopimelate decarboxylase n=1 Tax=Sphingomonas sp. Leaf67 TaxID=1736230 RepID=UPI0006FFB253|nr:diaminopimelate decarboxylase [Sphingomonas sp. Leaf67]KQN81509.1 diaminopimelate decarboxylase [Sphingomonas sp. Leaf67]
MDCFTLRNGTLHAEDVSLPAIADAVGTPVYVYSTATLERHVRVFREAVAGLGTGEPLVAFAVKANPNKAVLATLARAGMGADVVSGGELYRALDAGMDPDKIVFSGVGKTADEMAQGLNAGIGQFNVESEPELDMLSAVATRLGTVARIAIRVNPDVVAGTHAKISTGGKENKFGIDYHAAPAAYAHAASLPGIQVRGVAVHIGSQLTDLVPLEAAFGRVGALIATLRAAGHTITHADLGGGLGVPYDPARPLPPSPAEYGAMVARATAGWDARLMFEPGRLIVANAGVLVSRVIRVKQGATAPFVVVDAAMNDLLRPSLYDAYHDIRAVRPTGERAVANIVGPVCETGDTFALGRAMDVVAADDLVAFMTAGAYGATMASTYNSRALVPEVLVAGDRFAVVRERPPIAALAEADRLPPWL